MNPFMAFLVLGLFCQVITAQQNLKKCARGEWLCGSTCIHHLKKCHCGGQTFGIDYSNPKVCCLSDSSSCSKDSDGKLSKIVLNFKISNLNSLLLGNGHCTNGKVQYEGQPCENGLCPAVYPWKSRLPCKDSKGSLSCSEEKYSTEVCKGKKDLCPR